MSIKSHKLQKLLKAVGIEKKKPVQVHQKKAQHDQPLPLAGKRFVFITDSFSANSGGRTASMFQRCKLFLSLGAECSIASMNFKVDYAYSFASLCAKYGVEGATFVNPYEFLSGTTLFKKISNNQKVRPLQDEFQQKFVFDQVQLLDEHHFLGTAEDGTVWNASLRADGTIASAVLSTDGHNTEKRIFRRDGALARKQVYSHEEIVAQDMFYTPQGYCYLRIQYQPNGKDIQLIQWYGSKNGQVKQFDSMKTLLDCWIAHMEKQHPGTYFVSEFRGIDDSLLANPLAGKLKVIGQVHSTFFAKPYRFGSPVNEYLDKLLNNIDQYDAVITLTNQERDHICALFGQHDNLFTIPHPFTPPILEKTPQKEPFSLVVCSRLVKLKRIDHIIKAVRIAHESIPEIKLHIYGSGEDEERLKQVAQDEAAEDCVIFHGYTSNPAEVVASAEASVTTSLYEGVGMSTVESLCLGTPVISYDYLYGPEDLIQNFVNGFLVPNGNIEYLAQAIVYAFSDRDRLSEMSQNAKSILEKVSDDIIADAWIDALKKIEGTNALRKENESLFTVSRFSLTSAEEEMDGDTPTLTIRMEARKSSPEFKAQGYNLNLLPKNISGETAFLIIPGAVEALDRQTDAITFTLPLRDEAKQLTEKEILQSLSKAHVNLIRYGSSIMIPVGGILE